MWKWYRENFGNEWWRRWLLQLLQNARQSFPAWSKQWEPWGWGRPESFHLRYKLYVLRQERLLPQRLRWFSSLWSHLFLRFEHIWVLGKRYPGRQLCLRTAGIERLPPLDPIIYWVSNNSTPTSYLRSPSRIKNCSNIWDISEFFIFLLRSDLIFQIIL